MAAINPATKLLLESFMDVQRTRARLYAELQAGFKSLTGARNEQMYSALLARLSTRFNDCSHQVIAIEAQLKAAQRPDLASLLRTVQENEREKLKLTLSLHALKGMYSNQAFSWQHDGHDEDMDLLDSHLGHVSLGKGGAKCGCCTGGAGEEAAPEATEEEYRGAVKEALVLQNDAIEAINDVLEEVSEMLNEDEG